jgi:hypothetical protein
MRNAYLQNRDFKVSGGRSKNEEEEEQRLLEEAGEDHDTQTQSSPAQPAQPAQPNPTPSPH